MDKSKIMFAVGLTMAIAAALLMVVVETKGEFPYFPMILGVCGISLIATSGFRLLK